MRAFSIDLRQRVVNAYDAIKDSQKEIADRFAVSYFWVLKILRQHRLTESIEPLPHGGGQRHDREKTALNGARPVPGSPRWFP